MNNIEFIEGSKELLNHVKPLWEKLNRHHERHSKYFSQKFKNMCFEERCRKFLNNTTLKLKIDLVKDTSNDLYIGYCITTINQDCIGEIDSVYIEPDYRKYGIGSTLIRNAINWLNNNNVKRKIIGVAEGNELAIEFYKRFNFYPRIIILEEAN